jgi:excisionase family DNA binding protein
MYNNRKEWENDIISLTEAAEILGISRQRVHVLLSNEQLEGFKVGNTWNVYKSSVENRLAR